MRRWGWEFAQRHRMPWLLGTIVLNWPPHMTILRNLSIYRMHDCYHFWNLSKSRAKKCNLGLSNSEICALTPALQTFPCLVRKLYWILLTQNVCSPCLAHSDKFRLLIRISWKAFWKHSSTSICGGFLRAGPGAGPCRHSRGGGDCTPGPKEHTIKETWGAGRHKLPLVQHTLRNSEI